ncbi:uncharacterized protein DNG_10486 [Cephalotrichum gorgonifer]|nr:uncharacterized protein DNG_10486 [Cephalotrichum gorgonifer]
MDDYLDI